MEPEPTATQPIQLQIDGEVFATLILPALQAVGARYQRGGNDD